MIAVPQPAFAAANPVPAKRSRAPLVAAIAVVGVTVAIVIAVVASKGDGTQSTASAGSAATIAAKVEGSAAAGSASTPTTTIAVTAGSGAGSAAGSGAGSGSAAATGYKVGDTVYAIWEGDGHWYPGKIAKLNADGTYKVNYTDGDSSARVTAKRIKPRKASASSGKSGGSCPSGLNMCSGRCVDQYNDRNNCFGCGRRCPDGHICKGGMCGAP